MSGFTRDTKATSTTNKPFKKQEHTAGPLAFFITLFIVAIGAIQLISTMHSYALSVAELNGLKKQEAQLIRQRDDLNNQIARWKDPAYITSKAREELGFIFPGEQPIRLLHADEIPGVHIPKNQDSSLHQDVQVNLPWYSEMLYSLEQADKPLATASSQPTAKQPVQPSKTPPAGGAKHR